MISLEGSELKHVCKLTVWIGRYAFVKVVPTLILFFLPQPPPTTTEGLWGPFLKTGNCYITVGQ